MKAIKSLLVLLVAILLVVPFGVFAEDEVSTSGYNTMTLKETLEAEDIDFDEDEYEPASDAINIYMFRGQGCGYCKKFLTFLSSIVSDYGKYFNLVSYEVWQDQANSELMNTVADTLGQEAGGVPFIVIGEKVFPGYAEDYDESIKEAIKDLYDTDVNKRYDVFDHLGETKKDEKKNSNDIIVGVVTVLIIGGIVAAAVVVRKNNK